MNIFFYNSIHFSQIAISLISAHKIFLIFYTLLKIDHKSTPARTNYPRQQSLRQHKKIPSETLDRLLEVLRVSPSSINIQPWVDNQIHITLGSILISASAEGVIAMPIGGFYNVLLDEILGASALGLRIVVIMALGYRSTEDFDADLPNGRVSKERVIFFLSVIFKAILYFQKV